jgi:L-alanine-DL-glutamate epimerase-like enolase superfamily enzyme
VLIETTTPGRVGTGDAGDPPAELAAELAWCLRRFVTGRADEPAMRRAEQALAAWELWQEGLTVELTSP